MSNPVKVTPEYIAAVVEHRRGLWGEKWSPSIHECSLITGDIAALLTHLHANPRVPTEEQANRLWAIGLESNMDKNETDHAAKNLCVAWGRIMFAPQPPAVPDAVKALLFGGSYGDAVSMAKADERILACYELVQQMGKAK